MINILYSASLSIILIDSLQLPYKLKLNFKPFNCKVCLAGWLCLLFNLASLHFDIIENIGQMATAMVLNIFINKLLN